MNDLLCNIRTTQVLDDGDTNTQHSLEPCQVFIAHVHKQKPHVLKHTSLSVKNSSYLYSVNKCVEGVIFNTIVDKFWGCHKLQGLINLCVSVCPSIVQGF